MTASEANPREPDDATPSTGRRLPRSQDPRRQLHPLGPLAQLRAGGLWRRVPQLLLGLVLFGVSMAMLVRATLGVMPWDVLHQGVARHVPLTFGQVVIAVSILVLLLWVPLRQAPGLGTVCNAVLVGIVVDPVLGLISTPDGWGGRIALMVGGLVLNGLATALYIGAQLGPGARDGLMTGLAARTGRSLRLVRTLLEVAVVIVGWLLGGVLGVATVLYALLIGPLTQAFLPWTVAPLDPPPAPHTLDP